MKNKKIVIAGGSGFIGQELTKYFGRDNDLIILTRNQPGTANNRNHYDLFEGRRLARVTYLQWTGKPRQSSSRSEWEIALEGADLLINLAGKTVNCRYNEKNRREIIESRIDAVVALGQAIRDCQVPPKLWINASSATIYRHAEDRPQDEYTGEYGKGFSVEVCQRWEKIFDEQVVSNTRKVVLRMAITLGAGGVLIPYFNLLKFGLGGKQGNGKQFFSWIHIEDTCRMIEWIDENNDIEGVYNCSAPNPLTNKDYMKELQIATGKSWGLPAPAWLLRLGAGIIGTETELVLKSRRVVPTKMLETGFEFKYPYISGALTDIIQAVPVKQYRLF